MNSLILKEKKNTMGRVLFNIIFLTVFETVILVILDLIINLKNICDSEWFKELTCQLSADNRIIVEKINMIKPLIITYGLGAVIILSVIFFIINKSNIDKTAERVYIMHSIGYSRNKIWIYFVSGFLIDFIISVIITLFSINKVLNKVNEIAGIEEAIIKSGIKSEHSALILFCIFSLIALQSLLMYGKVKK